MEASLQQRGGVEQDYTTYNPDDGSFEVLGLDRPWTAKLAHCSKARALLAVTALAVAAVVYVVMNDVLRQKVVCAGGGQRVAGNTTCFEGTSCAARYSANGRGCCPHEGAVCCPNGQTCCPSGTTCSDSGTYLTTCMKGAAKVGPGLSVCKPGAAGAMSKALPNVLIIGDSVSIGYTCPVAAHMAKLALVQHSPFDTVDGGAEETAYGVQCLDYMLRSPAGVLLKPDVVMFNWGLHDGPLANGTVPGQNGSPDVYGAQLANITAQLIAKEPQAKLLFALTSPSLCSVKGDGSVSHEP